MPKTEAMHTHDWELATGSFLRDHRSFHGTGLYVVALRCECGEVAVAVHHVNEPEPREILVGQTLADIDMAGVRARYVT